MNTKRLGVGDFDFGVDVASPKSLKRLRVFDNHNAFFGAAPVEPELAEPSAASASRPGFSRSRSGELSVSLAASSTTTGASATSARSPASSASPSAE